VVTLRHGTDTSAGAELRLSSFESLISLGVDFLSRNSLLELATQGVGFTADGVLNGFVISNTPMRGTNAFCYNFPGRSCQNDNFGSIRDDQLAPVNGPGEFLPVQVPAPATAELLLLGLAGLGGQSGKKSEQNA
jgi:hypothetical protein